MYICVSRYIYLMFQHRNRAPFVDIVVLKKSFAVVISSVLILKYPGKLTRFPPATSLVRQGSSIWGL